MTFRTLDQAQLGAKRALVRVDFNVPVKDGEVADDARLRCALPTINALRRAGAKTILISHFGRPKGKRVASMSLRPVAAPLAKLLAAPVAFAEDCVGPTAKAAVDAMKPGEALLLENLRFHPGEEASDPNFARALAANGDLYIDDAFSAAHRAHASTVGVASLLPAFADEDMRREPQALRGALDHPAHPVLGIVGGSKVSTKLDMLHNLILKLDRLAIGGGMANTFLFSQGWPVGASICEKDLADAARDIMAFAERHNCELLLPVDVVVAERAAPGAKARVCALGRLDDIERILDAGPKTLQRLIAAIDEAKTLVWNGPLGVFEVPPSIRRPWPPRATPRSASRPASWWRWLAAVTRMRRCTRQESQATSPSSPPQAAHFSSGWRARPCLASRPWTTSLREKVDESRRS